MRTIESKQYPGIVYEIRPWGYRGETSWITFMHPKYRRCMFHIPSPTFDDVEFCDWVYTKYKELSRDLGAIGAIYRGWNLISDTPVGKELF